MNPLSEILEATPGAALIINVSIIMIIIVIIFKKILLLLSLLCQGFAHAANSLVLGCCIVGYLLLCFLFLHVSVCAGSLFFVVTYRMCLLVFEKIVNSRTDAIAFWYPRPLPGRHGAFLLEAKERQRAHLGVQSRIR